MDKVCSSARPDPPLTISLSDIHYLDATTATPTFVSWMTTQVRSVIPLCSRNYQSPPLPIIPEGDYFDLRLVPERYTGYAGHDANRVWRTIYEENCFGLSELNLMSSKGAAPVSLAETMIEVLHEEDESDSQHCLEKRVYYKVISGVFHAPQPNSVP